MKSATVCLAAMVTLVLATAPAAFAASTTMTMTFSNQTTAPVKVSLWGDGDSTTHTVAPGKSISFSKKARAWLDSHRAYAYTFMARSLEPGDINCRGQIAVGNIWSTEPMVVSCDANINFGDCKVIKHKRSMGDCLIDIGTTE